VEFKNCAVLRANWQRRFVEFMEAMEAGTERPDEFNSIKTGSSNRGPDLVSVAVVDMPNAVEIQSKMAATPRTGRWRENAGASATLRPLS
jgi:hypothetical protein